MLKSLTSKINQKMKKKKEEICSQRRTLDLLFQDYIKGIQNREKSQRLILANNHVAK